MTVASAYYKEVAGDRSRLLVVSNHWDLPALLFVGHDDFLYPGNLCKSRRFVVEDVIECIAYLGNGSIGYDDLFVDPGKIGVGPAFAAIEGP